jgi:hypothetical protein
MDFYETILVLLLNQFYIYKLIPNFSSTLLLRYSMTIIHTFKVFLKYSQWFLAYSQSCATITTC